MFQCIIHKLIDFRSLDLIFKMLQYKTDVCDVCENLLKWFVTARFVCR